MTAISRNDVVIDAYCGIGTLTLALAKKAQKVYGIEMIEAAVTDARKNAALNQVERAEFMTSDASQWMAQFVSDENKADINCSGSTTKRVDRRFYKQSCCS